MSNDGNDGCLVGISALITIVVFMWLIIMYVR